MLVEVEDRAHQHTVEFFALATRQDHKSNAGPRTLLRVCWQRHELLRDLRIGFSAETVVLRRWCDDLAFGIGQPEEGEVTEAHLVLGHLINAFVLGFERCEEAHGLR